MNGFEIRKEKKIKQIFSASLDLVSQYGFDKVSVNEIAEKARVSPATIYNYFGTKEQLYQNMMEDWIDSKIEEYNTILASDHSYHEKMREILTLEAENITFLTHLNQGKDSAYTQLFLHEIEEKLELFFHELVHMGKREGYIASHFSDEVLQKYFTLFFNEIGKHINDQSKSMQDKELDQFLQLFFYGLSMAETE